MSLFKLFVRMYKNQWNSSSSKKEGHYKFKAYKHWKDEWVIFRSCKIPHHSVSFGEQLKSAHSIIDIDDWLDFFTLVAPKTLLFNDE